jgi:hypothetical protein
MPLLAVALRLRFLKSACNKSTPAGEGSRVEAAAAITQLLGDLDRTAHHEPRMRKASISQVDHGDAVTGRLAW